jgi:hypothetical protein
MSEINTFFFPRIRFILDLDFLSELIAGSFSLTLSSLSSRIFPVPRSKYQSFSRLLMFVNLIPVNCREKVVRMLWARVRLKRFLEIGNA